MDNKSITIVLTPEQIKQIRKYTKEHFRSWIFSLVNCSEGKFEILFFDTFKVTKFGNDKMNNGNFVIELLERFISFKDWNIWRTLSKG